MKGTFEEVKRWGNGGIVIAATSEEVVLEHEDLLTCGNRTYYVFELRGYLHEQREKALRTLQHHVKEKNESAAFCWGTDPFLTSIDEQMEESLGKGNGQKLVHFSPRAAVICKGQHPDYGKVFLKFGKGDVFTIDSKRWQVESLGDHPRLVELKSGIDVDKVEVDIE